MYLVVYAVSAVAACLSLWSYRHELRRAADLVDARRGRLRRGRRLDPGSIHPDFAKRRPELPTLLVFVRNGCEYCDQGLEALYAAIPGDAVNACIAYALEDGRPSWSSAITGRSIIAGVEGKAFETLSVDMVPRWIWISSKGAVVTDIAGFSGELSLGMLLGGYASATSSERFPLRRRGGRGTSSGRR